MTATPDDPMLIGMAFGAGSVRDDRGRVEKVWSLVVRGEAIEGRFALRGGAFVELAEDA